MLLIVEIILTIFAWKKGWRWLSLIPLGLALLIGMVIGLSGATNLSFIYIIDILAIVALIIMNVKAPKSEDKTE